MTQTVRRIPRQRADARRAGAVYLHVTRRVDSHGMPAGGVEDGYVGRSRDVPRRTGQHAGLVPQRDGTVAEQPWWDLRVGETRILQDGRFTDAELDELERDWIAKLRPRYNDLDNPRADRVRKFEARRHRDARDVARGLTPRLWIPTVAAPLTRVRSSRAWRMLWSRWPRRLYAFLLLFAAVSWTVDEIGQDWTFTTRLALTSGVFAGVWLWWRLKGRKRWRRMKRSWR